jgi:hypothetical protein
MMGFEWFRGGRKDLAGPENQKKVLNETVNGRKPMENKNKTYKKEAFEDF